MVLAEINAGCFGWELNRCYQLERSGREKKSRKAAKAQRKLIWTKIKLPGL
jgi:hypothetical protein